MDFRKWQEEQLKQRKVETKNENSFFSRKSELVELETFLSDRKTQIFCLYGVPMIGKTTLVRQFLKNVKDFEALTIQFNNPENPEITLDKKLAEINWKTETPKLIVVENFEEALQLKGDQNHLHEINFGLVRQFLEYISKIPYIKVILESRFQIKLDFLPRIYTTLSNNQLGKIDRQELYKSLNSLYRRNSVSFETFEKVCEKFDDHIWLIEMAMQDDWHFPDVQETINHPKTITQKLWDKLQEILKRLPTSQRTLLCAFSIVNPMSEPELESELGKLSMFQRKDELGDALFSLRKKLLAIYNVQNNSYELNPFLREVCFTFLREQREMKTLETLPYFSKTPKPRFDSIRQAQEKGDYGTFFRLIKEKRRNGEYKEVIEILEEDYLSNPNKVGVLNEIAITYKWQKDYDEAIKVLNKALEIEPDNVKLLNELAIIYKEQENYDEAIGIFKELIDKHKHIPAYNELAIIYKEQENYDEAIGIFKELIDKHKHIPSYNELAIIYKKQKNYDEAIKVSNEGLGREPNNVKLLNELAIIYKEQENYDEAIKVLNKGLGKEPNNVRLLNELASIYKEQKDYGEAIKVLNKALEINSSDVKALNELAIVYKEQKDYDEAIKILNKGLKIEPNNIFFKSTLKRIYQEIEKSKVQFTQNEKDMEQSKRKILFVAANPKNETRIQTDKEFQVISAEMPRGSHRDSFEFLQPQLAVTITDLLRAFDQKPQIIHFSGHGAEEGIVIAKDDNTSQLLNVAIMERLFKNLKGITEVVVLNSCYSAPQAEAISKFGMYVVGNTEPIGDNAAISFAKGLYVGLSQGKSFEDAMNDALIVVMTESSDFADIIEVWKDGNKLSV